MKKRWWVRAISILLVATLIGGTFAFLSFRVMVSPSKGLVSISLGYPVLAATGRQSPDAILELVNLTGTVSEIQDDPDSPDANWLDAVANNVASICRASFPTPPGNPTVGADLQEFRVLVRKFGGTGTPTAWIELYENGVLIRAGSAVNVTGDLVISFTWNANEIGTADGSLIECRLNSTAIGGAPSGRACAEVGAVEWNVDYSAAPSITVNPIEYDFGVVAESTEPYTSTSYFLIDNTSTMQTDQTISVTTSTWSGGVTWTHSDTATPGADTAGLKANKGGTWGTGDVIAKYNAPLNDIATNQPANTDYSFGLKLWSPTSFADGVQKQIVVRITAAAG